MYSFEDIKERSASVTSLILSYTDAMEILYLYGEKSVVVSGWDGWIVQSSGGLRMSQRHQGPAKISSLPQEAAIALAKGTIMQAHVEWEENPEDEDAQLFFHVRLPN